MSKKRKTLHQKTGKSNKPGNAQSRPGKPKPKEAKEATATNARHLEPIIPFSPDDAILLVGEGDLSFSRSLVEHHYCENVTATVLEANSDELTEKYPHVKENVDKVEAEGAKVVYGVDAKKMRAWAHKKGRESTGIMDRISTCTRRRPFYNIPC